MASVNEVLRDAAVGRAVDLSHYSNSVVRRIIGLLNKVDPDLFARLQAALDQMTPDNFTVERLDLLLNSVRALNVQAYLEIERELSGELRKFVGVEAEYQLELFRTTIPPQVVVQVGIAPVSVDQVYAAALSRPFQGRLLKEWTAGLGAQRDALIRDQVRIGFVSNESVSQIVQRIRGTRAKGYADGLWEAPRRHVEAVVRSAVSHTAATVRDDFYQANVDLVQALQWISTIDNRTSSLCRIRDHLKYTNEDNPKPVGHKVPWLAGPGALHFCCRSTSAPVLVDAAKLGLPDLTPATRASMDGQISAETTYMDWLQRQSAARQDEILGPTRGALLRKGGLDAKELYSTKGVYLTLEQLKERHAAAFKKAGV